MISVGRDSALFCRHEHYEIEIDRRCPRAPCSLHPFNVAFDRTDFVRFEVLLQSRKCTSSAQKKRYHRRQRLVCGQKC